MPADCRCARLKVGGRPTESREWNPDCPEHGVMSAWWNDPDRVAAREAESIRLRDLQLRAAEARRKARAWQRCPICGDYFDADLAGGPCRECA